uniref:Uncharacterized protein n=1 Tax=Anopheles epiroticus TaxID=199890 RepID=A0A182PXR4_9DIPT
LLHRWHSNGRLSVADVALTPQLRDRFRLRVELDSLLAVEVTIAQEATTATREREHGQRYRNRYVYTDLSNVYFVHKLACRRTVGREDGRTIAVRVVVDQLDCFVDRLNGQAHQYRAKDFLRVALHVRLHVADDGRPNKVALFELFHRDVAPIEHDLCALLRTRLYQLVDTLLRLGGDDRSNVRPGQVTRIYFQLAGTLHQIGNPVPCLADKYRRRERHTALTGRTERRSSQLVERIFLVCVRHNNAVVLGAHISLYALSITSGTVVNVLARLIGTYKGYRPNVRVVADKVDRVVRTMNDVHHTGRAAGLVQHLHQQHCRARDTLGRFDDACVAARDRYREHPQRNHGGEVERCNTGRYTERQRVRVRIHVLRNVWHGFTHLQRCDAAAVLHHLQSTQNITLGIDQRFALLLGDVFRQLRHVVADNVLQLEHDLLSAQDRRLAPGLVCLLGRFHRCLHFILRAFGNTRYYLVRGRIVQIDPVVRLRIDELAIDKHLCGRHGSCAVATLQSIAALFGNGEEK